MAASRRIRSVAPVSLAPFGRMRRPAPPLVEFDGPHPLAALRSGSVYAEHAANRSLTRIAPVGIVRLERSTSRAVSDALPTIRHSPYAEHLRTDTNNRLAPRSKTSGWVTAYQGPRGCSRTHSSREAGPDCDDQPCNGCTA